MLKKTLDSASIPNDLARQQQKRDIAVFEKWLEDHLASRIIDAKFTKQRFGDKSVEYFVAQAHVNQLQLLLGEFMF